MLSDIRAALDAILGSTPVLHTANGAGRVFELLILTSIARELQRRGREVWLQRSDGTRILPTDTDRRFIQRGGAPTGVASAASGPNNASSVRVRRKSGTPEWEIWNGVQFEGRSRGLHEIDIAVLSAEVGEHLRALATGGSPTGRPRVAIECKDVGAVGSPDEMRAFIARLYDLTLLCGHRRHLHVGTSPLKNIYPGSPAGGLAQVTYWNENRRTYNALARRTGFGAGAIAFTGYYAVAPHPHIIAGSPTTTVFIDAIVSWIENNLA